VKQNLPPAKSHASLIALVVFAIAFSASTCITLPQHASTEALLSLEAQKAEQRSLININTAAPEQLENLPGIGKVIAERIVAHREQYGPFRRAEHLLMVRGISDRKFRAIRPMISVQ
jgi:competence ComEA-like helix-hairpin-helix protein